MANPQVPSEEQFKQLKRDGQYKGVYIRRGRSGNSWAAQIFDSRIKKRRWLGTFSTPDEASEAYQAATREVTADSINWGSSSSSGVAVAPTASLPAKDSVAPTASLLADSINWGISGSGVAVAPTMSLPAKDGSGVAVAPTLSLPAKEGSEDDLAFRLARSKAYYAGSGLLEEIISPFFPLPTP